MTEVEDIQSFIAAQKKRIEEERAGLQHANAGRRHVDNVNDYNPKMPQENRSSVRRQEQSKETAQNAVSPRGLAFGEYESVQERLRKERAEEYKKFLAEKNFRATGHASPRDKPVEKPSLKSVLRKQDFNQDPRADLSGADPARLIEQQKRHLDSETDQYSRPRVRTRPEKTLEELYDAYEELLERKRQDERRYRGGIDDPFLDARRVRFDDEFRPKPLGETWLENGNRRLWDRPDKAVDLVGGRGDRRAENVDARTFEDYQDKTRNQNQHLEDDRLSRSAPPKAVPLFGEHDMTPEAKKQRQSKYRDELQAQIKEREIQKKREKNHLIIGDSRNKETGLKLETQPHRDRHSRDYDPTQAPPPNQALSSSRLPFDQPRNPFINQPYNYPGLLPSGAPLSTFNPPSMLGGYPMSFREPLGSYQPSWVNDPMQIQRPSGLMTSGLATEIGNVGDKNMENRHGQSTGVERTAFGDTMSGIGALPHSEANRDQERRKQQSYREELTRQMMEKEERVKKEKEAVEKYNMKLEKEIEEYNPWGKSGGGAPIKDQTGRIVSDLRKMHQYNKEGTIISPRDHATNHDSYLKKELDGFTSNIVNTAAVSTIPKQDPVVPSFETNEPKKVQLEYKDFLRQQMEEKQKKKKEEEERLKELEARQDKIIKEQQERLRLEYEKEVEASRQKEEAVRVKNEEIRKAAEEKKKEMERKRLEEDRKAEERLRKQLDERLRAAKAKNAGGSASPPLPNSHGDQVRSSSPPIPTLQRKNQEDNRPASPPIPTLQKQVRSNSPPIPTLEQNEESEQPAEPRSRPDVESQFPVERQTLVKTQTPRSASSAGRNRRQFDQPAPASPKDMAARRKSSDQELRRRPPSVTADIDVLSQLTSLRRQLKNEEIKVQRQLSENKEKYAKLRENSASQRGKKPPGNVFDNVLRKNPAISQKEEDPKSFGAMDEFNKLKYEDSSSLHGDFISRYPDPATTSSTLDVQQKSLLREQQKRLQAFRDTLLTTDKENVESFSNIARPTSKTSQLESDSQFVSVEDPSRVVVDQGETSQSPARIPSARERRRWKQLEQLAKSYKLSDYKPPTPGGFSLNSVTSFNVDELAQKNEERLRRLEAMKQARSESKGDPNEVLKKFIQQHSRPESKVSEKSLPADKRYLPNM